MVQADLTRALAAGFVCGVEHGRRGAKPIPPNPYHLRTAERSAWHDGYHAGRQLGTTQREAADAAFADLLKGAA